MVKNLYAVWIKIDETLPWIELKGAYQTKKEAREAAKELLRKIGIEIVSTAERKRQMKVLASMKYS